MSFFSVIDKTRARKQLFTALVELTYRCNLDCYFCYNDLALTGKALSLEQYKRFLRDLRDLETLYLILSGGEPLAHPHFFEIGAYARELGFVVRVKSNGHSLRGRMAQRLKEEVDPYIVDVSLHGATADTHDRQTQVPGSFERLLENIDEMQRRGLRLQINSALTAWNEHQIEEMMALTRERGLSLRIDPEVSPRDDGDKTPLSIQPSRQAVQRLFRLQAEARALDTDKAKLDVAREGDELEFQHLSDAHCGAGFSSIAVNPYGDVYPCVQWRRSIGNLHEKSLRRIWRESTELVEIRRQNVAARDRVKEEGDVGRLVGFCPGAANRDTGNGATLYPAVEHRLELQRQVMAEGRRVRLPIVQ